MISQTVEYSLRAVIVLANQYDESMTVREMADIAKLPAPYLSKIMKSLVRAGIVQSRRGLGGGFKLARTPEEITIWDVTQAIDPLERIHKCPVGIEGHATLCPLHQRIDQAIAQIEVTFKASSLAEILSESGDSKPLCEELSVTQIEESKKNKSQKTSTLDTKAPPHAKRSKKPS